VLGIKEEREDDEYQYYTADVAVTAPDYIYTLRGHLACFLFKLRAGVLPVADVLVRRRFQTDATCGVCRAAKEDLEHFL